jgi:hypothetical protein
MEEWDMFCQRSIKDLKMAKICYDNADFELSSYLIQQSLEKSIKAYLLKNKAIDNPEDLRHLPLHRIFGLLKEDMKKRIKHHQNNKSLFLTYERGILMIGKLTELFDDIKKPVKNSKTKIPIWKQSLGISLSADEQKITDYWMHELQPAISRTFGSLKKYVDGLTDSQFAMVEKQLGVSKEKLKEYSRLFTDENLLKNLQNSDPATVENVTNIGLGIIKQFEESPNFIKSAPDQMAMNVLEPLIFVIKLKTLIVSTVVHEDLGRYPTVVDDKTSTKWYEEKHENLKTLMNQVEIACSEIEHNMKK